MARIRLEFVPIDWFALGWLGFDHLQLVFEPDGAPDAPPQDDWYVLEGSSGHSPAGLIVDVMGDDGRTTLSAANLAAGADLVRKIGTPPMRGSAVLPVKGDPLAAWDRMAACAREINAGRHPYWSIGLFRRFHPVVNSSSVVASLLWEIGIDVHHHMPSGLVFSPGTDTLLGGGRSYGLPAGGPAFDTLVGGEGDDDLSGSDDPARLEKLFGGLGNDTFHWTSGNNYIHGGQPGLSTRVDGYDTVDYSGAGRIEVRAAPWWLLMRGSDYVVTFSGSLTGRAGGTDLLTSIERLVLDGATDRLTVGPRMTAIPRRLDIDIRSTSLEQDCGCLDVSLAKRGITVRALGDDRVELALGTRQGGRVWQITGVRCLVGTAQDDLIQMSPSMRVAEGGDGDDVIDARRVTPGQASRFWGYDAEIDGGTGDDILIACRGRTFARGGAGRNTFILPRLAEAGGRFGPELVIADGKPGDCLLVPQGASAEDRDAKTRLRRVTGALSARAFSDTVRGGPGLAIQAAREKDDLVLTLGGCEGEEGRGADSRPAAGRGPAATVRLLHFHNGDMGIVHSAFD